ncbi:6586_t:CDS:1, partial [Diversispora eburnea]
ITESSVSGILELNFLPDKPAHAKQIDITLKGVEYVFWTEKHGESTKVHRHKEILICQDICVWRSHDNTYQEINELQFPFQFELPNHLPSSVKFAREESKIYYSLKASMKQESSMLKFLGSTESIKIRCPITRYSLFPTISNPTHFSNYDDPSAVSRGIGYSLSLEHNVF